MSDYPSPVNSYSDSNLSPEMKDILDKLIKDKTPKELRAMYRYISNECDDLCNQMESNITMEDFDKIKKKSTQSIPTENYDT